MKLQHVRYRGRASGADHRTRIDYAESVVMTDRLHSTIAALEKIQINRCRRRRLVKMRFHADPPLGARLSVTRHCGQVRPTPCRIDYRLCFKNLIFGTDTERA